MASVAYIQLYKANHTLITSLSVHGLVKGLMCLERYFKGEGPSCTATSKAWIVWACLVYYLQIHWVDSEIIRLLLVY